VRGLEGRVGVVAGGGSGIGAASARRLAAAGCRVVVGDIDEASAERVAAEIRAAGADAEAVAFDLGDEASAARPVERALERWGAVDVVHANGADLSEATLGRDVDVLDCPEEVWSRTLSVNLLGHVRVIRAALPRMLELGSGRIVCTSSAAAFAGDSTRVAYACSKAGVNALVRHVAARFGRRGIRCNGVSPGFVATATARASLPPEELRTLAERRGIARLGDPEDVAAMVAFLLSDDASWINGQVYNVDGGSRFRD